MARTKQTARKPRPPKGLPRAPVPKRKLETIEEEVLPEPKPSTTIVIVVEDACVQDVLNLPRGCFYRVVDHDVPFHDSHDEDEDQDEDEEKDLLTIVVAGGMVESVHNLPEGCDYTVRDLDCIATAQKKRRLGVIPEDDEEKEKPGRPRDEDPFGVMSPLPQPQPQKPKPKPKPNQWHFRPEANTNPKFLFFALESEFEPGSPDLTKAIRARFDWHVARAASWCNFSGLSLDDEMLLEADEDRALETLDGVTDRRPGTARCVRYNKTYLVGGWTPH